MKPRVIVSREQAEKILSDLIPDEQLQIYEELISEARRRGIRFAIGGGLAASAYSGYVRNTKDMDLFVVSPDQEPLMRLMAEQGYEEYLEVKYDPTWSYRGFRQGYIVDLLWRMLNNRSPVDEVWTETGWELDIRGVPFRLLPAEELLWSKLYILRRERTDWPDILNIIYAQGPMLDWERILKNLGEDACVLGGIMSLFRWMCPGRSAEMPEWIWERMGLVAHGDVMPAVDRARTKLFNADDWFTCGGS